MILMGPFQLRVFCDSVIKLCVLSNVHTLHELCLSLQNFRVALYSKRITMLYIKCYNNIVYLKLFPEEWDTPYCLFYLVEKGSPP